MKFIDLVILISVLLILGFIAKFQFFSKNKCGRCKSRKSCKNIR